MEVKSSSGKTKLRNRSRILHLVLLLMTLPVDIVGLAQTSLYTVSGSVTGPGGPVAGASVRIEGWDYYRSSRLVEFTRTTDASGRFSAEVPEGVARLFVEPPAASGLLADYSGDISVPPGIDVRFTLARPITLSMRAVSTDGQPISATYEVYSLSSDRAFSPGLGYPQLRAVAGQTATIRVPADRYSIHAIRDDSPNGRGRLNVDARSGDLQNLTITVPVDAGAFLTREPPRASQIRVSSANDDGIATVTGLAGAVEGLSSVAVVNLLTHQTNLTVSESDGSFTLPMFAPPGSYLQIKHDPTGKFLPHMNLGAGGNDQFEVVAGTTIYVQPRGDPSLTISTGAALRSQQGDLRYRAWALVGAPDPGRIWIRGSLTQNDWQPGGTISAEGTLVFYSADLTESTDLSAIRMTGPVMLEKIINSTGQQLQEPNQSFMSSILTPTGFPIERYGWGSFVGNWTASRPRRVAAGRVEFDWALTSRLPNDLATGIYRLQLALWNIAGPSTAGYHLNIFPSPEGVEGNLGAALPVVRVGQPAANRLIWALGLNDFSNGSRGAIAAEDRDRFRFASHVKTNTEQFIVPMRDARTGKTISYRLEPFLPVVGHSKGRIGAIPQIPFKFPSGNLNVTVIRPDGVREDLGSAPFLQDMSRTPTTPGGSPISAASQHVTDLYELTTLDRRFEYTFTQYGSYRVIMRGTIEDIYGTKFEGGGTYEVTIARTLSIDTGAVPGTPFEVGDVYSPVVHVLPGIPAHVDIAFRLLPNSDPEKAIVRHIRGRANRFGYFDPKINEPIQLTAPGEYRVDITAEYTDDQGTLWKGAVTWGSIVETPNSPLVTHGRRGFDLSDRIQQQWFRVRYARTGGDHVMYPFHTGDVMWMEKNDNAADVPKISLQDSQGSLAARVRGLRSSDPLEAPSLEERIAVGEIPLFSTTSSRVGPSFDPSAISQWGYYYAFAERPGIHVREFISEDFNIDGYWRFKDDYNMQVGNGIGGDLPNDFKFQFGGAVYRSPADNFYYYGAYASLFVLLPLDDSVGGRVFPPFQGSGGGPSGGPIMRLKGKDIDIFFHPTGIRPGSILELGDMASFSGHVAPTLPSQVRIAITSPSGRIRRISGQADKIGYFYSPASDFVVDESGPYRVAVSVFHDGATSAGNVTAPYPTGDVLGSTDGQFDFYVVSAADPQPALSIPRESFRRPALEKITVSAAPATPLSNTQLRYTAVMPGFILEEGTASNLTYTYDAAALHLNFPNLDLSDADGFTGQDPITVSMLISGRDSAGRLVYQARQIFLAGEELLALPAGTRSFSLADQGAMTLTSSGSGAATEAGYVCIQPAAGSNAPTGMAIFGFRQDGVLVTEAAVPPAPLLRAGRIPAEVRGAINTGVAIANPNEQDASITYYFTDSEGRDFGRGTTAIPGNGQIAVFLTENPFRVPDGTVATLTFSSNVPVAAVALRGRTNERSEFLLSALPVIDVAAAVTTPLLLPHFADGGGWTTEVSLVNPSDERLSGTIKFKDQAGAPMLVTVSGSIASSFSYALPPRSSSRLQTSGTGLPIRAGSVRIEPSPSQKTPSAFAIFSFRNEGVVVTEAAVIAAGPAQSFRLYGESLTGMQTGLAFANTAPAEITATVEALRLDGSSTGLTGSLRVPANGQTALFTEQIPGLETLPSGFQGVLRISTTATNLVVAGLRGRTNERNDFLITTLPAQPETATPATSELVFPHFADGGGYTTQFILMPVSGRASGILKFVGQSGQWLYPFK
jgi:hypothetical protein